MRAPAERRPLRGAFPFTTRSFTPLQVPLGRSLALAATCAASATSRKPMHVAFQHACARLSSPVLLRMATAAVVLAARVLTTPSGGRLMRCALLRVVARRRPTAVQPLNFPHECCVDVVVFLLTGHGQGARLRLFRRAPAI